MNFCFALIKLQLITIYHIAWTYLLRRSKISTLPKNEIKRVWPFVVLSILNIFEIIKNTCFNKETRMTTSRELDKQTLSIIKEWELIDMKIIKKRKSYTNSHMCYIFPFSFFVRPLNICFITLFVRLSNNDCLCFATYGCCLSY